MAQPSTIAMLRFAEADVSIPPSDDVGNLADLMPDTGTTTPAVAASLVGTGRAFAVGTGLTAQDLVPGSTLTSRDVTVRALLAWDLDGQAAAAQTGTIIARGKGGATAELVSYALELRVINQAARIGEIRWWWHDSAGTQRVQIGGQFVAPPANAYMLVTAVRHWISPTQVEIRYFIGDTVVGDAVSTDGDIAGGTTGTTCIGTRYASGTAGAFLVGVLDELEVRNYETSIEESEATWRRIAVHQPSGYRAIRELMPPRAPISSDPSSRIQKLLRIAGHMIGYCTAQIENVRTNLLPDRAWGPALTSWERALTEAPGPLDSIRVRRARLLSHTAQHDGARIAGVTAAISGLLALPASQIQFIGGSSTKRDSFATLDTLRWRPDPAASWTLAPGGAAARVQASSGANLLWDGTTRQWSTLLTSVDATPRWLPGAPGCAAIVKLTPTALPADAEAGLTFADLARVNVITLGVRNTGSAIQVVTERFLRGVSQGATVLATSSAVTHWLQIVQATSALISDATGETLQPHTLTWSTTGPTTGLTSAGPVSFSYCVNWIGCYARTLTASGATLPSALDVRFTDVVIRSARSTRPFRWYVYRDPALPGQPDIGAAQRAVNRLAHAFTQGRVIQRLAFAPGDPLSLLGSTPFGGF